MTKTIFIFESQRQQKYVSPPTKRSFNVSLQCHHKKMPHSKQKHFKEEEEEEAKKHVKIDEQIASSNKLKIGYYDK